MSIHFVQAGGTIDKYYPRGDDHHGRNFAIGVPGFQSIIAKVEFTDPEYTYSLACQKDSLDLTDDDRWTILQHTNKNHPYVIITHGTDTIKETAEYLAKGLGADSSQVVILTGAFQPQVMVNSDADFNVGMAVGAIKHLKPGVYIALFRRVIHWEKYVDLSD